MLKTDNAGATPTPAPPSTNAELPPRHTVVAVMPLSQQQQVAPAGSYDGNDSDSAGASGGKISTNAQVSDADVSGASGGEIFKRRHSLRQAKAVMHEIQGHANVMKAKADKSTRAMMKGVGKGVSVFADTSKAMLGDLKIKSLQALIPALLQDIQDGNLDGVKHMIALADDSRNTTELESIRDLEGRTVLHKAAAGGHVAVIKLLLGAIERKWAQKEDASRHQQDAAERTKKQSHLQDALINAVDFYGNTPLTALCMSGAQAGSHSNRLRRMSNKPLEKASSKSANLLLAARTLRSAGARMNVTKHITKDTALHWVAFHGEPDVISELTGASQADGLWCVLARNRQSQFPLDVSGLRYADARLLQYQQETPHLHDPTSCSANYFPTVLARAETTMLRCMEAGARALRYFGDNKLSSAATTTTNTVADAPLSVGKHILLKYSAHWLYWASVMGNVPQVKQALASYGGNTALHTQINCHGQRTALHAACRFAHPDIVELLLGHEDTALRRRGSPSSNTPEDMVAATSRPSNHQRGRADHYVATSILKVLDHQRDSVLHLAIIASNTAILLERARQIVESLVTSALAHNTDLGLSQRNQNALLPLDYAKDGVIRKSIEAYDTKLKQRRSGNMLRSVSRSMKTLVIPARQERAPARETAAEEAAETVATAGSSKIHGGGLSFGGAADASKIKYVWVLAFAKSIDLPGVQHQYDKVASWLRDVHAGLLIDVIPSVVKDVVGTKNEVFIGVGVTGDAELNVLAEMVKYEARLLQGTIPGEKEPFFEEDAKLFEPFRTREREDILLKVIHSVFALQTYLDSGVITRVFPLHDTEEARLVRESWVEGPPRQRGGSCCCGVRCCKIQSKNQKAKAHRTLAKEAKARTNEAASNRRCAVSVPRRPPTKRGGSRWVHYVCILQSRWTLTTTRFR